MSADDYAAKFALSIKNKGRKKDVGEADEDTTRIDQIGEQLGFVSREGNQGSQGGRPKSGKVQIHAWISAEVRNEIAEHALDEGFTQGKLLEKAWQVYKKKLELK